MKKQMTIPVNVTLMHAFRRACAVEGLTPSQGLTVAIDCFEAGELSLRVSDAPRGPNVCFTLDVDTIRAFRRIGEATGKVRSRVMHELIRGALLDGFGAPTIAQRVAA